MVDYCSLITTSKSTDFLRGRVSSLFLKINYKFHLRKVDTEQFIQIISITFDLSKNRYGDGGIGLAEFKKQLGIIIIYKVYIC